MESKREQYWQDHDRREAERLALEKFHARERRKHFLLTLPSNLAVLTLALFVIWIVKSCESKESRADPDRTGLHGMPI